VNGFHLVTRRHYFAVDLSCALEVEDTIVVSITVWALVHWFSPCFLNSPCFDVHMTWHPIPTRISIPYYPRDVNTSYSTTPHLLHPGDYSYHVFHHTFHSFFQLREGVRSCVSVYPCLFGSTSERVVLLFRALQLLHIQSMYNESILRRANSGSVHGNRHIGIDIFSHIHPPHLI